MAEKTYIATQPLFVGTARAHNPGDEVPADNVKLHGWEDAVVGSETKTAKELLERLAGTPTPATGAESTPTP